MLIKSIIFKNFRQYENLTVDFSTDKMKNVTLIKGDNGTGKTTIAQAFKWCLYGETDFTDKILLNATVSAGLMPTEKANVSVAIEFEHHNREYKVSRSCTYIKKSDGKCKIDGNAVLKVWRKQEDGIYAGISKDEQNTITGIIPEQLYRYFFFDGEHIEEMSKTMMKNGNNKLFSEAVTSLTGLKAYQNVIEHIKPGKVNSVYARFDNEFGKGSNSDIEKLNLRIQEIDKQVDAKKDEAEKLKVDIADTEQSIDTLNAELAQYKRGADIQRQIKKQEQLKGTLVASRSSKIRQVVMSFSSRERKRFLMMNIIKQALEVVSKSDVADKEIPDMHNNTVEFLIKRGKCICGTHLDEGSIPYNNLKQLCEYLPPNSVSSAIGNFMRNCRLEYNSPIRFKENIEGHIGEISQYDEDIEKFDDEISRLEGQLLDGDPLAEETRIQHRISDLKSTLIRSKRRRDDINMQIGGLEADKKRLISSRDDMALMDRHNKLILHRQMYVKRLYDMFLGIYNARKRETKEKFQKYINENFKRLFDEDLHLQIDDEYKVRFFISTMSDLDRSTAQGVAIIFAFLSSIIMLARENNEKDTDGSLLIEPYPLVMDAPLSTFDKKRIKAVSEALPNIAEQVIIFIKDTDGDVAEQYLSGRIGKRYEIKKRDGFHADIV